MNRKKKINQTRKSKSKANAKPHGHNKPQSLKMIVPD